MIDSCLFSSARALTYREIREVTRPLRFAGAVTYPCDYADSRRLAVYRAHMDLTARISPAHRAARRRLPRNGGF